MESHFLSRINTFERMPSNSCDQCKLFNDDVRLQETIFPVEKFIYVMMLWCFITPQESATQGSLIPISRQAQTKLEVCLYSFLWSPDAEAVLVAMSCFRHLCEEADIRCSVDELPVHTVLPNYNTFMEFASVSNMMATGQ